VEHWVGDPPQSIQVGQFNVLRTDCELVTPPFTYTLSSLDDPNSQLPYFLAFNLSTRTLQLNPWIRST
jgi:hypothetical protein